MEQNSASAQDSVLDSALDSVQDSVLEPKIAESYADVSSRELTPLEVNASAEAATLRQQIVDAGRKLWERQYVDGNAGNISVRIGSRYVLCTPTRVSKGEMSHDDICLSDMDGNIVAGNRLKTSEIFLHLEIYKATEDARAVVHCHPPYGTAFALTRTAPPFGLHSEYDTMIGPAAVAPYETPGTRAFAETVRPFVRNHNTIVLANHGIVCWADTVTHAEWLVETFETYCRTWLISQQIAQATGRAVQPIPGDKILEILEIKRRMGLPDQRLSGADSKL
jgi:L-fuculose-phosphate aldolase